MESKNVEADIKIAVLPCVPGVEIQGVDVDSLNSSLEMSVIIGSVLSSVDIVIDDEESTSGRAVLSLESPGISNRDQVDTFYRKIRRKLENNLSEEEISIDVMATMMTYLEGIDYSIYIVIDTGESHSLICLSDLEVLMEQSRFNEDDSLDRISLAALASGRTPLLGKTSSFICVRFETSSQLDNFEGNLEIQFEDNTYNVFDLLASKEHQLNKLAKL